MTLDPTNLTMESVKPIMAPKIQRLKYILLDVSGIPTPIIFPAHLPHDTVVPQTPICKQDGKVFSGPTYEVISAGFCEIESMAPFWSKESSIKVTVSGGSTSLQKSARAEDAELIERALR